MTQGKRLFLICRTLLLPFCAPDFGAQDPLVQKAKCYRKFLYGEGRESTLYQGYTKIQKQLLQRLGQQVPPQRLDELQQLLELFYRDDVLLDALERRSEPCKTRDRCDVCDQPRIPENSSELDAFYLDRISEISDTFLTMRDGRPALRNWTQPSKSDLFPGYANIHKAELWNMLIRESTPDLWIASYYVSLGMRLSDLWNVPDEPIAADLALMKKLSQGLADTHTHFNAGLNYQIEWALVTDVLQLDRQTERVRQKKLIEPAALVLKAGLLRLFLADYVHNHANPAGDDLLAFYEKRLSPGLYRILESAIFWDDAKHAACLAYFDQRVLYEKELKEYFPSLLVQRGQTREYESRDLLERTVYEHQISLNTSCDILLFFESLRLARQMQKPGFYHALLQYIRLKNLFFQPITQSETVHGLKMFREYYGYAVSAAEQLRDIGSFYLTQSVFRSYCRQSYIRLMEGKICPPQVSACRGADSELMRIRYQNCVKKQLHDLFSAYFDLMQQFAQNHVKGDETEGQTLDRLQREGVLSIPTIGIVYHFSKAEHRRNRYRQICWAAAEPDKEENPFYVETLRRRAILFSDVLSALFREVPYLAEYVVGLDAASDELHSEPWVYAPIFRHARRKANTYPVQGTSASAMPSIGLTYHVGEEFRTLLSGLRAVDEVITHFGYKAGDRLGHALALQVDPAEWQRENVVAIQPQMEYLENLLWVWHLRSQFTSAQVDTAIPDLEFKIMEIADRLYPHAESLSPYLLWRSYQQKFQMLDADKIQALRKAERSCRFSVLHDPAECAQCGAKRLRKSCRLADDRTTAGGSFAWTADDLLLTHFCPLYTRKYEIPIFVPTTQAEVAMLTELQREIKQKIEQRGITVEVNPTSNASIGEISHLFAHPILKLNNRGLGCPDQTANHMSITINTDDPLVFRTTTENEISYIYYMLMDMGYSQTDVLDWIDQVRRFGFDSSFIRREKKPSVQYRELQTVLCGLKDA